MRKIIIATIFGALPTCVAAAELPKKTTTPPREVKTNPCAAYGAGFVKVEGSTTCVKIGGNVSVEAGRSR
jgi:Porin subfamily